MTELNKELKYWIWLASRLGVGSKYVIELLDRFEDAFEIYSADSETLAGLSDFMSGAMINKLADKRIDAAASILEECERKDIDIIHVNDKRYPKRLRSIQNPPVVLYLRGTLPDLDSELCIGVVGTRKISEYGCRAAYRISNDLSRAGVVTVSGMALGVDGIVACAGLAEGAKTVAVLGTGIDVVYPSRHRKIYEELVKHGTVLSEFPPGVRGASYTFPTRNRIISGLSQATFVVEADFGSGAIITAKDALVQGRELFALPGNVGSDNSKGTNELIRQGAHAVFGSEDILREFAPLYGHKLDMTVIRSSPPQYDAEVLERFGILPETHGLALSESAQNAPGAISPRAISSEGKNSNKEKATKAPNQKEKQTDIKEKDEAKQRENDKTVKAYASLDSTLRAVYDAMPEYETVTVDSIKVEGMGVGDIIASLTMLELYGLVKVMPGGVYSRA